MRWLHGSREDEIEPWPGAAGITDPVQWVMFQETVFHIDEKCGHTYFGIDHAAARTRYSEKTVRSALTDLAVAGFVKKWPKLGATTYYSVPAYREIDAPRGRSEAPTPVGATAVGDTAPPVAATAPPVGATADPGRSDRLSRREVEVKEIHVAVKPLTSGESHKSPSPTTPISDKQIAYLADLHLIDTGYLVTEGELVNWRAMSRAEADQEIKFLDGVIRAQRPDSIYVPEPLRQHLSEEGRRFYEQVTDREWAA